MARLGYAAVSGAAVLWATGAAVASRLFDRGASPLQVTAARAWVGVAVIGAMVLARRRARASGFPLLSIPFGLSIAAANFFYYSAIARIPVAIAIVIQYTAPGIVVVWVAIRDGSIPSRRVGIALGSAFGGVALLSGLPQLVARGSVNLDVLGVLFSLASAIAFASYVLLAEPMGARFGPDGALARGFAVASVFWALALIPGGRPDTLLEPSYAGAIAFVTFGGTIAPFLLFLWGLGHVGAARAGIASTLEPVAAALIALVFLDQALSVQQWIGGALVVAGIAVVQTERPPSPAVAVEAAAVE